MLRPRNRSSAVAPIPAAWAAPEAGWRDDDALAVPTVGTEFESIGRRSVALTARGRPARIGDQGNAIRNKRLE
jgi:hypothetical protein